MAHYGWQNYNVGQLQPEPAVGSGAGARATGRYVTANHMDH